MYLPSFEFSFHFKMVIRFDLKNSLMSVLETSLKFVVSEHSKKVSAVMKFFYVSKTVISLQPHSMQPGSDSATNWPTLTGSSSRASI